MTRWRLLAEIPAFVRRPLPEEVRPLVLGNWRVVGRVILLDPSVPPGENWLNVCEVSEGEHRRFLNWMSDAQPPTSRYYVATSEDTGFRSESPLYEGHWRQSIDEDSEWPWPTPDPDWPGRGVFLERLARIESSAYRVIYRGISRCRVCGESNGHEAFRLRRWEWPAGFRHYVTEHGVRPSADFEALLADHQSGPGA